jgi:hypothetical protein
MRKNKKIMIFIAAGVLVIIGIIIAVCLFLRQPGGSGSETEEITINEDGIIDEQEKVVLDVRLDRDITMMEMAYGTEEIPGYLEEVEELRSYEILEATQEEDVIYTTVLVKAPDLYTITKNLQIEGELTEEKIDAALMAALQDAVLVETEVELIYQKINGVWEAAMTEEFVDAYTGGLLRLRDEYYDEILGGATDEE